MRILVGLGNPGQEYAGNRHNIGFMAVDEIVRRHGFGPWRQKYRARVAEGSIGGDKALAMEPLTYMNDSGLAVAAAANFYKVATSDIFVFHDELDLAPGRVRIKQGGGAAGHNGLRSLDAHVGNETWRVRLGIGHPGSKEAVLRWVLGDFAKADKVWLEPLLDAVAIELPRLLAGDANGYMSRVAQVFAPPKAPAESKGAGEA